MGSCITKIDKKKITYDFKEVSLSKFKEFFEAAKEVLKQCEDIREGLEDSREIVIDKTGVNSLVKPEFLDAVRVFVWSISSVNEGKILQAKPCITEVIPYLDLDRSNLKEDQIEILNALQKFLNTASTAPLKVPNLLEKVKEMGSYLSDLTKTIKSEIINGISIMKMPKEASNLYSNMKEFTQNVVKVKRLPELVKIGTTDLGNVLLHLRELIFKADEVGRKAFDAGLINPKEIFNQFYESTKNMDRDTTFNQV